MATRTSWPTRPRPRSTAGGWHGISTMTEPWVAGNSRDKTSSASRCSLGNEEACHGKALLRNRRKSPGPGPRDDVGAERQPRTGIPADRLVSRRAKRNGAVRMAPKRRAAHRWAGAGDAGLPFSFSLGGEAVAMVARKINARPARDRALLECPKRTRVGDGRFFVSSAKNRGVTSQECAAAAYGKCRTA